MSEVLQANLQLDIAGFSDALVKASQQVAAFAQAVGASIGNSAQAFQQQVQQMNSLAESIRKNSDVTRAAKRQEVADTIQASKDMVDQERATGDFITKLHRDITNEKATQLKAQETLQADFLKNILGMEKVAAVERENLKKQETALQSAFFKNTVGMAKQAEEAQIASQRQFMQVALAISKERIAAMTHLEADFLKITLGMGREREAAAAQEAAGLTAQYRAIAEFRTKSARDAAIVEKQTRKDVEAQEAATSSFIMRQAKERTDFQIALQRDFLRNTIAMAQEQKRIEETRFLGRNAAANAQANFNIAGGLAGGPAGLMPLAVLQGYVHLAEQASQQTSLFDNMIARVGTSIKTLGGYFAASAIIGIPFAIAAWGKEAIDAAIKMQSLQAAFTAIAGSAAKGARELQFVRDTANRLGLDFLQTAESFKSLEAASRNTSLEGAKTKAIFEAVSTASRVMGLTADQTGRSLLAIEQMMSKGVVSAEELRRQLGNAIPGAFNIMARAIGVTTEELNAMLKTGSVLSEDVLPKFAAQLQKEFGPGLATASRTAAATFARLGNEIREISVGIGQSLLSSLQPAADFLAKLLASARQANEGFRREAARTIEEARAGKPLAGFTGTEASMPIGATEEEMRQMARLGNLIQIIRGQMEKLTGPTLIEETKKLQEQINRIQEEIRMLDAVIEERSQKGAIEEDAFRGDADAQQRYKKNVEEILTLHKQLPAEMAKINSLAESLPTLYGKTEEKLKVVKKLTEEYRDLIDKNPNLRYDKSVQEAVAKTEDVAKALKGEIDAREAAEKAEKDRERERTRTENENIRKANAMAAERVRIEQRLHEEIAEFEDVGIGRRTEQYNKLLADAKRVAADEVLVAEASHVIRMKLLQEEGQKIIALHDIESEALREKEEINKEVEQRIAAIGARGTKSKLDNFRVEMQAVRDWLQDLIDHEQVAEEAMNRLNEAIAGGEQKILQDETTEELKKQQRRWEELANTIEGTLSSAFRSVLSGSKNAFEGIRDAFLNLLAKLAADALTNAIIIPAIVKFVGGGGIAGAGAGAGIAGSGGPGFFGAGVVGGGGTGGGNDLVGSALGIAGAGAQGYSALTGGSIFGAGGVLGGLAATELGFLPGIGTSLGGVGPGMVGAPSTALGATSLGTVASGVGVGIAAGMILKQLNNMLGIKGTGGTVLAGAGGGAIAGTMILPGIGTAIGTAVGALGGYLASLFGGNTKEAKFGFRDVQPGRVGYTNELGLTIDQNFKIIRDLHEKLGIDYEEFAGLINNSMNELFEQVVSQVKSATPQVQSALVQPLNNAFQNIADTLEQFHDISGEQGEEFKNKLEKLLGEQIPKAFEDGAGGAINQFLDAVKKIDPLVQGFNKIIDTLLQDIRELERQQKALDAQLEGNIIGLRESLFSPGDILRQRQGQFGELVGQYNSGDITTRLQLAPIIGQLSNEIMELSKSIYTTFQAQGAPGLNTINQTIRTLEESLFTPQQILGARQGDFELLMAQFRMGDDTIREELTPEIAGLALQIMELSKGVNTLAEATTLIADFPAQIRAINEAFFGPAQTYMSQRDQLNAMMALFRTATPQEQIEMEPQIASLAAQILQLARGGDVLGQDPQLMRQVQQEMLAVVQEIQAVIQGQASQGQGESESVQAVLQRTQSSLLSSLKEVQTGMVSALVKNGADVMNALFVTAGNIIGTSHYVSGQIINAQYQTQNGIISAQYTTSGQFIGAQYATAGGVVAAVGGAASQTANLTNAMWYTQHALIGAVQSVQASSWQEYAGLIHALWTEIGLAQHEINLLTQSLWNLGSVDAAVQRASQILGEMNWRLANPLGVYMGENLMTQLQRDSTFWINQLYVGQMRSSGAQIALLAKIAYGMDWASGLQLGKQHVGMGNFQHGGLVPANMTANLHRGEYVVPEWEARHGGRGTAMTINVYGAGQSADHIADVVIQRIEQRSGRLQSSKIQVSRK